MPKCGHNGCWLQATDEIATAAATVTGQANLYWGAMTQNATTVGAYTAPVTIEVVSP